MNLLRKRERIRRESSAIPTREDRLATLCQGDERMHEALSHFLLARPEEQILQLGPTEALIQKAESRERSQPLMARVDFETAARMEIYRGDREKVEMLLGKAQRLSGASGEENRLTLLSNLDKAMEIAREYYQQGQPAKA